MPSRIAVLGDLGWLPITDHLDIIRASYFIHLQQMDNNRLAKVVFNELSHMHQNNVQVPFKYFSNLKCIFEDRGMDHMFANVDKLSLNVFKESVYASHQDFFTKEVGNYQSLQMYKMIKEDISCSDYLKSEDDRFRAVQLKFKLRTGVLGIGADLHRQHRGPGLCKRCNVFETSKHFIFECPAYNNERGIMLNNIRNNVNDNLFSFFIQDPNFALCAVLGDHDDCFNKHFLTFIDKAWVIRKEM
jgi:hypothetical protein